jgi:glycosyltransferase involved in cell wall biosynthesis
VNGGAAKVAISSARGLAEAGIAVTYVCAIGPVSVLLDHPRITVHCLNFGNVWGRRNPVGAAVQAIWSQAARKALFAILDDAPVGGAIVHIHQWSKAFSPSVLDGAARRGLPTVVSLHDYFIACPNGAYYNYGKAAICRLKPMSASCVASNCDRTSYGHKLVRVARQWATGFALARAGKALAFISVSPLAERVIDRYLAPNHARFVVRSPIEVSKAEPVAVGDNAQFLFVGRLTEEKGVRLLATAARDAGLPLTIVGDGPLLEELSRLGGAIRCAGWLDGAGVDQAMRQARALIFPSTWHETGGLVVLEALARGIPVIVSRVTAPVDFIEDGVNGFIVDPQDRAALVDRMRILGDDAVARRMGAEAYERYWGDPQDSARHTNDLLSAYRAMMRGHDAPPDDRERSDAALLGAA